jgi:hypothetical protein
MRKKRELAREARCRPLKNHKIYPSCMVHEAHAIIFKKRNSNTTNVAVPKSLK